MIIKGGFKINNRSRTVTDIFKQFSSHYQVQMAELIIIYPQSTSRAAIQRRGSVLAWIVILIGNGADTIAIDLSLSALMLVSSFNLSQSFNYTPYLFYKKRLKSEINCFCIWTQCEEK
jgi:hypothetical protein